MKLVRTIAPVLGKPLFVGFAIGSISLLLFRYKGTLYRSVFDGALRARWFPSKPMCGFCFRDSVGSFSTVS